MEEDVVNQGGNPELYQYLVEKFEGTDTEIEVLDNGGYWITNWNAEGAYDNQMYIPADLNSNNVSMISYLPGSGGFRTDAEPLREKIFSDDPPNCIITLAQGCDDKGNTMEAAATICEENGLNISNLTVQTFSASGGVGFQQLEKYLENHPDTTATMIVADGYNMDSYNGYLNNIDTLAELQVPIVLVNPTNNSRLDSAFKYLYNNGLNMYVLESNQGGHININKDIINNGILEYSLGIADEFGGPNNNLEECNYLLYVYDPENPDANNRGYVLLDGYEDIRQENMTFGYTLERLKENPFETGTIASDMYSVTQSLNSIRGCITNNTVQTPSYSSTSTIPGNFVNAQSSLIGISSDLNNTIYNETKVISSIAQVFYDMDRERTNAANALSNGSELLFDEAAYTDVLNELIKVDISSEIKFESFMFNPSSHVEGNSGKLCLSDIDSMLSGGSLTGPLHENLENERVSARNTKTELDNLNTMITSGGNFQGSIWTQVSSRLTEYSELMDTRIEVADILETAMVEALTLLKDYMGDYEELDDSKLPELREKVNQIKDAIIEAQQIVDATHTVTKTYEDDRGGTNYYYVTEYVYSASARSSAKEYIRQAQLALREIEKEIVKLEGLPIILAQAEQIINDALDEVYNKYGIKVSNVVTGKEASYIPPTNTTYTAPALPTYKAWTYQREIPEGKVDRGRFYMDSDLMNRFGGSYEDYLNGVERDNNPMYNRDIEDNGIEPGESLDNKIFEDEDEVLEETEDEEDTGETENPQEETPVGTPSSNPPQSETPGEPSQPETPSEPSQPETPSEPSQPETPSEPSQPETPSEPSQPETPSEPSQPETPSEPSQPETPSEPTVPSSPEKPSEQSKPNTPSTPTTPSTPEGDTPGFDGTIDEDLVIEPEDTNNNNTDSSDDMFNDTIPPVIDIPEDDTIVDITPPIDESINDQSENTNNLIKKVGIGLGVGAAVGAAALGAHTVTKKKKYDYED